MENTRSCAGYIIIRSFPVDDRHEIVIGRHPSAPSPYVCWYCIDGNDYHTGAYCRTFPQALQTLADRIRLSSEFLPLDV